MSESIGLYSLFRPHDWSLSMNDTVKTARTTDVEVLVRLPVSTPMIDWAAAMTALSDTLGGTWSYRAAPGLPRGRFEIEVLPEVAP